MQKRPWRKVLWEDQGCPDDYTDTQTFLRDLRTHQPCSRSLPEAILGATLLLEEFCTVTAFVLVYVYMFNEWVRPELVLRCSSALTVLGFLLYRYVYLKGAKSRIGHDLRTLLIFGVFGHLFSPVFHTLTDTISTDTIYTMTFLMLFVHLVFFDYGVSAAIVSNSLSLSAAVFASICLASRLASAHQAFIFITVAIEAFVLFPLLRNEMRKPALLSLVLFVGDVYFLLEASPLFAFLFICTVVLVGVVCPVLFVASQKHKRNIYGPWDEAIVDDADNVIYRLK